MQNFLNFWQFFRLHFCLDQYRFVSFSTVIYLSTIISIAAAYEEGDIDI